MFAIFNLDYFPCSIKQSTFHGSLVYYLLYSACFCYRTDNISIKDKDVPWLESIIAVGLLKCYYKIKGASDLEEYLFRIVNFTILTITYLLESKMFLWVLLEHTNINSIWKVIEPTLNPTGKKNYYRYKISRTGIKCP